MDIVIYFNNLLIKIIKGMDSNISCILPFGSYYFPQNQLFVKVIYYNAVGLFIIINFEDRRMFVVISFVVIISIVINYSFLFDAYFINFVGSRIFIIYYRGSMFD